MTDTIKPEDVAPAAAFLGVTPAHVLAVGDVEGAGVAMVAPGRPLIRCEGSHFRRLTQMRFDDTHPDLSFAYGQRRQHPQPNDQARRWDERFVPMMALDRAAAIQATSFGPFQMMGFNYRRCGFATPEDFYAAHCRSVADQVMAAAKYIKSCNADDELRREDWAGFAAIYNGPDFRVNDYDRKLARAYDRRRRA